MPSCFLPAPVKMCQALEVAASFRNATNDMYLRACQEQKTLEGAY